MTKPKKHIEPSNEQLRRYVAGELSPAEQHQIEKAALENERIDDTIEGLRKIKNANVEDKKALEELRERLHQRVQKRQRSWLPYYYASAAAVVLVVGLGWWLTQKAEMPAKASTAIALQQPPPVLKPESVPAEVGSPLPSIASSAKAERFDRKPVSTPKKEAVAEITAAFKPAPTLELEEKASDVPSLEVAPAAIQMLDSGQNVAVNPKMPERIAMAPTVALSKRSAFSAVKNEEVFTVRGKVLTANLEALPGVALQLKNQLRGVSTDVGGNFTLPNVRRGDQITVLSVGFEKIQLTVSDSIIAPIVLKEDEQPLSEVVVTAPSRNAKIMSQEATPKNGWEKYKNYLENSAKAYITQNPQAPRGQVRLSFVVTSSGELVDFKAINKADSSLFEEAVRIIKSGDSWGAGLRSGQLVTDKVLVLVDFK
ncbi:carboxypeptidase-like regulatory domain-containing protein [Runella aurantiaca]|uniref:TonB C-terminal domain-containing protein n=1 Tax=Runella aurantiaca TaxID=2282308 RepID=A0A369I9J3_9BACT|nr:carboxypeptidase-like regulatory domain-containing protein [Runella aurantiaca]RDB05157.1 hypothetical protein DVG78_14855 [Runella aurantiaca]